MQIPPRRKRLLTFADRVGITTGYRPQWNSLLNRSGITESNTHCVDRSAYSNFAASFLLEWRKSRKQPGFTSSVAKQRAIKAWVDGVIKASEPDIVVCSDPALLFLVNKDWNQATLDRLRGGVYIVDDVVWVICLPISALNTKMKAADIAKLNEGFLEKADWEEYRASEDGEEDMDDSENETMEWHEPIFVPYGLTVLNFDFAKVGRLLGRVK